MEKYYSKRNADGSMRIVSVITKGSTEYVNFVADGLTMNEANAFLVRLTNI